MFAPGLRWAVSLATATLIAVRATTAGVGLTTCAGGAFFVVATLVATRAVTGRATGVVVTGTCAIVVVVGWVVVVGCAAGVVARWLFAARFARIAVAARGVVACGDVATCA